MRLPCCLCVCIWPHLPLFKFCIPELIFIELSMYIMASEPTSTAHVTSLCTHLCVPLTVVRQQLDTHIPTARNIYKNNRIVGCIIFYVAHILSKETLSVCLCILYRCQATAR
jgi:hypothetical protein